MALIRLLKAHLDAGIAHAAGETLDIDDVAAQWLIAQGVAEPASQPPPLPMFGGDETIHND